MAVTLGGGSLLIAWQLKGKRVLIIGGGEVASQRIASILTTDADIIVVAPSDGLNSQTKTLIDEHASRITHHNRKFAGPEELEGMDMVLTALDDAELSRDICTMCRTAKIPINAADIPDLCDFYFGSQIRDGPLQIMVSTNGKGPRMADLLKKKLQAALTGIEGQAITRVGELRVQLRLRAPGIGGELSKRRMRWMTRVCNTWKMEELAQLDDAMIQKLLNDGWEHDRVLSFAELGGHNNLATKLDYFSTVKGPALGFAAGVLCTIAVFFTRRR